MVGVCAESSQPSEWHNCQITFASLWCWQERSPTIDCSDLSDDVHLFSALAGLLFTNNVQTTTADRTSLCDGNHDGPVKRKTQQKMKVIRKIWETRLAWRKKNYRKQTLRHKATGVLAKSQGRPTDISKKIRAEQQRWRVTWQAYLAVSLGWPRLLFSW